MNRSGLKVSGSGYMTGSCKIALRTTRLSRQTGRETERHRTMNSQLPLRLQHTGRPSVKEVVSLHDQPFGMK